MKRFLTLFAIVLAGALFAEKQPLSRYQSIIDRRPFGQPPPGYDPDSPILDAAAAAAAAMTPEELTQEQAQLQRSVSFSVMNINTDGSVSVGFTDHSNPKAPAHYYLRVEETSNGWLVKSVDVHEQTTVLEKDGIEISLHLGDKSQGDAKGGRGRGAVPARAAAHGRNGLLGGAGDGSSDSYSSRRQRRAQEAAAIEKQRADLEAERKRQAEESEAKEAEEKEARAQEREATRQQLQAIQEELRKAREEKSRHKEEGGDHEDDDA